MFTLALDLNLIRKEVFSEFTFYVISSSMSLLRRFLVYEACYLANFLNIPGVCIGLFLYIFREKQGDHQVLGYSCIQLCLRLARNLPSHHHILQVNLDFERSVFSLDSCPET